MLANNVSSFFCFLPLQNGCFDMETFLSGYERAEKVVGKWHARSRRLEAEKNFLEQAMKVVQSAITIDREDGEDLVQTYGLLCQLEGRRDERYNHWKQVVQIQSGVLMMMDAVGGRGADDSSHYSEIPESESDDYPLETLKSEDDLGGGKEHYTGKSKYSINSLLPSSKGSKTSGAADSEDGFCDEEERNK